MNTKNIIINCSLIYFVFLYFLYSYTYANCDEIRKSSYILNEADYKTTRRAMLISCDNFVNFSNTGNAAQSNLNSVLLSWMQKEFEIAEENHYINNISSLGQLENALQSSFSSSDSDDINYIYICTHGVYNEPGFEAESSLIFSDGKNEAAISSSMIKKAFKNISGTNFIIIDACKSGSLIGKGISGGAAYIDFSSSTFKILTSAGGSEDSWYWQKSNAIYDNNRVLLGAGYFSAALSHGLSSEYGFPADYNFDGNITLFELYNYVYENNAPSTPQVFPQKDNTVLFKYDNRQVIESANINNISFFDTVLTSNKKTLSFSFTVKKEIVPMYQIVIYNDSSWQFSNSELIVDPECKKNSNGIYTSLKPGRYSRDINLMLQDDKASGYIMFQFLTLKNDKMENVTNRLISILPYDGLENPSINVGQAFQPLYGQEMPIIISHNVPCRISLYVYNNTGELVSCIISNKPSRPQNLLPEGSSFSWNGKTDATMYARPGVYYILAKLDLPNQNILLKSNTFELLPIKIPIYNY